MITKDIFSSPSLVANLQSVPDNIKKIYTCYVVAQFGKPKTWFWGFPNIIILHKQAF